MATPSGQPVYRATTTAPVNIAVIKCVFSLLPLNNLSIEAIAF
jgi:hypothetical protein